MPSVRVAGPIDPSQKAQRERIIGVQRIAHLDREEPRHPFRYDAPMLIVHHLENSRSQRVLWLLEELGLPYDVRRYERDRKTMLAPPELVRVHPLGKSPVITDDGLTVAETGAIVEYLVDKADGALRPAAGTPQFLRYRYWLHFAEGSAMPPLLMKLVFDRVASAPVPFFVKPVVKGIAAKVLGDFVMPNIVRQLDFMESELEGREWFCGSAFSAADVMMSFPLEAAAQRAGLDASRPRLQALLASMHARPGYRRALERGGPYRVAD
jgi:glutathione S-transferase